MRRKKSPTNWPYIYCCAAATAGAGLLLFLRHIYFQPYLYLCGAVLSGLGLKLFYRQITFLFRTRKTYGTLVSWYKQSHSTSGGGTIIDYYAELEFEAPDGSKHQVRSATGCSSPVKRIGRSYPVRYDPKKPSDARMDTLFDYWGPPIVISLFGGALFYFSFVAK